MSRMAELDIVRQEHNIPLGTPNLLELLTRIAQQDGKCIWCGELFIYARAASAPSGEINNPGNVYSALGLQEVRISGSCEYCFDEMFPEEESCSVCGEPIDYCLGNHEKPEDF